MSHPDLAICSFWGKSVALNRFVKKERKCKKGKEQRTDSHMSATEAENDFNTLTECKGKNAKTYEQH